MAGNAVGIDQANGHADAKALLDRLGKLALQGIEVLRRSLKICGVTSICTSARSSPFSCVNTI